MKISANNLMDFVRAVVTPAITLSGWGAIVYMVINAMSIPDAFWSTVGTSTAFWFATFRQGNGPHAGPPATPGGSP